MAAPATPPTNASELEGDALVQMLKDLQKEDPEFRSEWIQYCNEHGNGRRDPARHDDDWLRKATDDLGVTERLRDRPQRAERREADTSRRGGRGGGGRGRADNPAADSGSARGGGRGRATDAKETRDDEHARLVEKVKGYQQHKEWRDAWSEHCDKAADGVYDPAAHSTGFIRRALGQLRRHLPNDGGDDDDSAPEQRRLVADVKEKQKDSQWHTRWSDYCNAYGDGTRDPARHTEAFLEKALRELGNGFDDSDERAALVAEVKKKQKEVRGWNVHWGRYCERHSDGTHDPTMHEVYFLKAAIQDVEKRMTKSSEHAALVEKVKQAQRDDPSWRTRWADYCEEYGDGTRDPMYHDVSFLKRALRDLAPEDPRNRVGLRSNAAEHERLVDMVKAYQRADVRWQSRWVDYCDSKSDGTLDPRQHDVGFLRKAVRELCTTSRRRQDQAAQQRYDEIQMLCEARRTAQRTRAYDRADELRKMLWSMGVEVNDKRREWRSDDGLQGSFDDAQHDVAIKAGRGRHTAEGRGGGKVRE